MAPADHDRANDQSEASFLDALLSSQNQAVASVAACRQAIERAADAISQRLAAGGRLIYIGAGSSGLIALQDGAELPGTFGVGLDRIVFLIAGGLANLAHIDPEAEDDAAGAAADVAALGQLNRDVVIALSASGSTPYTLARAKAARESGASLVALSNRARSALLNVADHPIFLDSGPEALHGSTRLAAGTAQKCALGILSTIANSRLGHVYRGHMVNVRPGNEKLRQRAIHIVASIAGVDERAADASLGCAKGDVKCAIVIASGAATRAAAETLIAQANGHIGAALAQLHSRTATF
jgi:N-acetylmuramic acid 6-phosphate etherase